jgi:hypothetical protein
VTAPRPFTAEDIGDPAKFWALVNIVGEGKCWPWGGAHTPFGHGHIMRRANGRTLKYFAHRVAYALTHGFAEITGKIVMHSCDNPLCCNPKHLSVGTQADNMQDASAKGRMYCNNFNTSYSKKIVTPDGIFDTATEAAAHYGRHPRNIAWRCRNNKFGFSYSDGERTLIRKSVC